MKYCHSCRYEFKDEVDECPDCGVELSTEPPAPDKYKEVEWVELYQVNGTMYAEMIKEVLDNAEIPNYLSFDFMSSAYLLRGANLVGTSGKLFVPKDFKDEALDVIEPMINEEGGDTAES
ncbi:MAG: DUF2007 domain-containing protein [Candidatus Marinimicrobia bacterium]|nr:DUF2007 domain-containing protein [Candidatus Neomarinimicrobiota bacterium]MCF7829099.1 DUF2007 domain-containing protein [Candidatus Neomarinimicrobiota bacterium]MCF7881502.1 DUF2007 domain-containing protein [Candidatus Neomarinimicrobiota bacterium]